MNEKLQVHYRGWAMMPTAIPQGDGTWSGNVELEAVDGDGADTFQGGFPNVVRDSKEDAIVAACDAARGHIDDLIADPAYQRQGNAPSGAGGTS